ncbi:phosphonate ABC transporter, permease protein PhnE [Thiothrix subterranea]|uniref:Phosphonate ABC transporter, permease protein PhnE n=1 Tax=Thiothrix subterranea TaxID=2735563 RepID=A0ABU0Y7F8_9GAMM|nr:phosphonate ABC transporter, permease protein PhnE [Thiothrix subterranea]MDQ5768717.1 phosphonate ABC transporter, permease protein PhnE [Thiothrix subterranea]
MATERLLNLPALPPKPRNLLPVWVSLLLGLCWLVVWHLDISFQTLLWGWQDILEYFSRYSSPDFRHAPKYLWLMLETMAMGLWGTVLAFAIAFLLAPYAARNLSPNPWVYNLTRELLNFMRAMPDILLALILVSIMGLGPLPGALALGIHTAGFLGKFFAESLERVEHGRYEALDAVGAGFSQKVLYAGWPSILREMTGYTLYILDRNIRTGAVLGLVGAGGIGIALYDTLRMFNYNQAAALLIIMLGAIIVLDRLSGLIRSKLH